MVRVLILPASLPANERIFQPHQRWRQGSPWQGARNLCIPPGHQLAGRDPGIPPGTLPLEAGGQTSGCPSRAARWERTPPGYTVQCAEEEGIGTWSAACRAGKRSPSVRLPPESCRCTRLLQFPPVQAPAHGYNNPAMGWHPVSHPAPARRQPHHASSMPAPGEGHTPPAGL